MNLASGAAKATVAKKETRIIVFMMRAPQELRLLNEVIQVRYVCTTYSTSISKFGQEYGEHVCLASNKDYIAFANTGFRIMTRHFVNDLFHIAHNIANCPAVSILFECAKSATVKLNRIFVLHFKMLFIHFSPYYRQWISRGSSSLNIYVADCRNALVSHAD